MNRLLDAGRLAASVLLVVAAMVEGLEIAQQPGFVVTPLLWTDLSGDPGPCSRHRAGRIRSRRRDWPPLS